MSDAKNSATKEVEATTNNVDMGFKKKLIPVFFGIGVFLFDQITKWLVIKYIPLYTIKMQLFGDFFQLVHVRNLGAAFSVGGNLPQGLRSVLLAAVPLVILVIAMVGISNWIESGSEKYNERHN